MGMRRREFITLVGGAVAASPFTVRAQADGIKRLTILMSVADDPEGQARVAAFRQGLQQLGWAEGRNVRIEYRWGNADADRLHRPPRRFQRAGAGSHLDERPVRRH